SSSSASNSSRLPASVTSGANSAALSAASALGSNIPAISAQPLRAIASMRLRPIQPTPAKPSRGRTRGGVCASNWNAVSVIVNQRFEKITVTLLHPAERLRELIEAEAIGVEGRWIELAEKDRIDRRAHARK